ncbi:MAG: threonine aldolase [Bacilli bacterium]|nr:threonine aldolase [Bacilli bacterium]
MKYSFRNDYNQVGHPRIIQTLLDHANCVNVGYGEDIVTKELENMVSNLVDGDVKIYLLVGGTLANKLVLSKILAPYEAVIACETGHINVHETGAVEQTGHKILTVKKENGKLSSKDIHEVMNIHNEVHRVLPRVVYISNSTEVGTIYKKEELMDLYHTCKQYGLYLFLDGARLPIALTSSANDLNLKDIYNYTDVFYISGTKNGMPLGEMVVVKNELINSNFLYHLKNQGGMVSKTFTLSYMFKEYLKDDFYLELARNANKMAEYLKEELIKLNVNIKYLNDTNQIFVELNNDIIDTLSKEYDFEVWESNSNSTVIRLVTCFNTTLDGCNMLIEDLKKLLN